LDKAEWLKERKKGIGGSDIGIILGVNKWRSLIDLYLDKTSDEIIEKDSEIMYWGNVLESVVVDEFVRRTGKRVVESHEIHRHKEYDFFCASVDRLLVDEDAILECKTTSAFNSKNWEDEFIPESYILQCQWYMYVLDKPKAYIACLIGGQKFVWKEIIRNEHLICIMRNAALDFWNNYVLKGIPPEVDATSSGAISCLYPESNGETIDASDIEHYLDDLKTVQENIKAFKDAEESIKNKIKMFLGQNECGQTDKWKVTYKNRTKTIIDSKALKKDYPDIYKKYSKIFNSRYLVIKEEEQK
jgi:putative phage-type endonuclease